ncbi:hypothetical protein ACQP1O_43105 (plasmid) [Nocardia sp. CA-151230]|uniref:hypothetical protein n=1 Tax=Nocardia sp. CA-151230 TaxID=3239982 RepID=UPI003D9165AF
MAAERYRKKPVEIEAMHLNNRTTPEEVARWCGGLIAIPEGERYTGGPIVIEIDTLEGVMTARPGDWIIKGVEGEFYPIKDSIFRETYDAVES